MQHLFKFCLPIAFLLIGTPLRAQPSGIKKACVQNRDTNQPGGRPEKTSRDVINALTQKPNDPTGELSDDCDSDTEGAAVTVHNETLTGTVTKVNLVPTASGLSLEPSNEGGTTDER